MSTAEIVERNKPGSQALIAGAAQIVGLLAVIQLIRAALVWALANLLSLADKPVLPSWTDIFVFSGIGAVLLGIFRPTGQALGLGWGGQSRRAQEFYGVLIALFLILVLSSIGMGKDILVDNIKSALIIPVMEELIFRGWSWTHISARLSGRFAGALTWLFTSLLFSLWHIGYSDVLLRATAGVAGLFFGKVLLMKLIVALVIGLCAGLIRWRTGKVYGAILFHGMWNLFGR